MDKNEELLKFFHPRTQMLIKKGIPIQTTMPTNWGNGYVVTTSLSFDCDVCKHASFLSSLAEFKKVFFSEIGNSYDYLSDTETCYYIGQAKLNYGDSFSIGYPFFPNIPMEDAIDKIILSFQKTKNQIFGNIPAVVSIVETEMIGSWIKHIGYSVLVNRSEVIDFFQDLVFLDFIQTKKELVVFYNLKENPVLKIKKMNKIGISDLISTDKKLLDDYRRLGEQSFFQTYMREIK